MSRLFHASRARARASTSPGSTTSPMHSGRKNFRETVCCGRDDGQTCGDGLQAGIGEGIVNRRQRENIRGGKEARKILHSAQKSRARGSIEVCFSATGDQEQRVPAKKFYGLNGKSQALPFPAGARKKNAKCPFRNFEASPGIVAGGSRNTGSDSIGNNVDSFCWKIVPAADFPGHHA